MRCLVMLAMLGILAQPAVADPLKVGKGGQNAFSFTLLDLGLHENLFDPKVQSIEFPSGARTQQALAAGSIDIGLAGGTDLAAIARGADVKAIAAMGGPPDDFAITVRADSPLTSIENLRDARVGVTNLASLTAWLTQELSRRQGWGSDGIRRIPAGSGSTSWALLRTNQVEGVAGDLGSALQAQARGDGRILVRFGDVIHHFQTFVIYASDDALAHRANDVRAFLSGWLATIDFAKTHKSETTRTMAQLMGLDEAVTSLLYDALMPMLSQNGHFDPDGLRELTTAIRDQYGIDIDPAQLTTERYLPK